MMTRSIVGRFLILAVLLVSLGVIAQAALIITRGSGKAVAKATPAPLSAATAVASAAAATPAAATPAQDTAQGTAQGTAQPTDAAPVRVVYPGPLGDSPVQPRKFAASASAPPSPPQPAAQPIVQPAAQTSTPAAQAPAVQAAGMQAAGVQAPAPAASAQAAPAAPAPAKPSAVVVASADADTQPAAEPAARGGVNLNSASVDALNRLGGGHIGQSIVKHRPYGSVEDLVKKRVIRRSVYEQIKDQVAAQ